MRGKIRREPAVLLALRFMVIFAVLITPWPGWNDLYSQYFRALGQTVFGRDEGRREVVFSRADADSHAGLDTQLTLANRDLLDRDGRGLRIKTELDSRSIGWIPTALAFALIVATPISLRRRGLALIGGLVLVHGFILFSLLSWIWNNSADVSLITYSAWGKQLVDELNYTLMNQIGASFSIPVLIWIMVTFRHQDVLPST